MSEMVRATYYPNTMLTIESTRFGMPKTLNISLYQKPIAGKTIVKIDLLQCLADIWGDNVLFDRKRVYQLVSGDGISTKDYKRILTSFYKRFAAFANYCDDCYYFGDLSKPLHARFLEPLTQRISTEREIVHSYGGKFLAESEGYMYVAFPKRSQPTSMKGVCDIYA